MTATERKILIFDSSSLITAAKFNVGERLVLEFVLDHAKILIPQGVKTEAVDQGIREGYPDAWALSNCIRQGSIVVQATSLIGATFEQVINAYEIEEGDQEVLRLCRDTEQYDHVVVDDRLLYIICHRFRMHPLLLPDLIVMLGKEGYVAEDVCEGMLKAIRSRYRRGFIEHSLQALRGGL
ncbi:MAG: hypothetical protein H8D78_19480 [Chloroflexi bacterium]|nr:hypothetical protein [Chloroflexota bacterium]